MFWYQLRSNPTVEARLRRWDAVPAMPAGAFTFTLCSTNPPMRLYG